MPIPTPRPQPAAEHLETVTGRDALDRLAPPSPWAPDAPALGDVVPVPVDVRPTPGVTYALTADAVVTTTPEPSATAVGEYLADLLRPATGYPLPVSEAGPDTPAGGISLLITDTVTELADTVTGLTDHPEGYRLDVTADRVVIRARTGAGLFHGVQTLRQLLPAAIESRTTLAAPWIVPGGSIVDHPRFTYRGAMLDVARHFFPVADVRRYIDQIARYKINHLHLHLTDDQGWRIAIDSWPRLATVGGATEVGNGPGGYYTREQYREIVDYAASRHVTIVPEIDLPGHTNAALTAYDTLAPDGVTPTPYTDTEVGFSTVAVNRELTYDFVTDVLRELAELSPGPYLHIGGDEAFKLAAADYVAFMDRTQSIVAATGKTVVGWHQLAPAAHVPGRIIQYWGTATADPVVTEAVRQGARLILSPGNRTYLDMKYTSDTPLGQDWAGLIPVRTAYDWNPGAYLDDVPADAVLGVEAPLWTETIKSAGDIEVMAFPRLPAVAELGWSPATAHDWAGFRDRLAAQGPRWTIAGIAFHRSPEVPWPGPAPQPEAPAPDATDSGAAAPAGLPAGSPTRVIGPATPEVTTPDGGSLDRA